jgi:hypothetical protein
MATIGGSKDAGIAHATGIMFGFPELSMQVISTMGLGYNNLVTKLGFTSIFSDGFLIVVICNKK